MLRHGFRAMGTQIELLLDARSAGGLFEAGEREFHRLEAVLSRFRPDSELSRLNGERALHVGPELAELVPLALAARWSTGGRFDPTVHDALVAAGYDRTFELVAAGRGGSGSATVAPPRCGGRVEVDGTLVALEEGFSLDLGGIAKGWAADRVLAMLSSAGPALVDAGGDVVGGGRAWPVGVETSWGTITLELQDGALATSGRDRRVWRRNGRGDAHHVIDPATGEPAEGDLLTVTAAARTATEAEVRAKSLFLSGSAADAAAEADEEGQPAVLVTRDGRTVICGGLS
jgi:FAD:protein FMN transferase